ncbi:hypothetical protein FC39_GL000103 [Lactobacillus hamsteri DSM 5661 = JCM 6256]|uniref:Gram-positive cocci surface proteins LPxTG domain-containing protein n=2 Tax=Lactobacillus hamsteri TaxID=96565 RepID=A0A0R1YFE8_9LACO|nr:hypothetical protein FC39_GL000103 [Lactobacillus hamsteri DSM 5661 = JCM 6256]
MLSRNNQNIRLRRENEHNRFSIRKLSVGAASVLIGCVFYLNSGNVVQAANTDSTTPNAQSTEIKKGANDSADTETVKQKASNSATQNVGKDQEKSSALTPDQEEGKKEAEQDKAELKQHGEEVAKQKVEQEKQEAAKPKGDNQAVKDIENQLKNNPDFDYSDADEDPDQLNNARLMPQLAIQGEVPSLDAKAIWNADMQHTIGDMGIDIQIDDPSSYKLSWVKAPDVSKLGESTGIAKVEYASDYDEDNNPIYRSFNVTLPVDVVAGQKKKDGQVRITVNVVDANTHKIIDYYTWVGKKGGNEPGEDNVNPALGDGTNLINNNISALGFKSANEENLGNIDYDIDYFLDHDITRAIEVVPVSTKDGKPDVVLDDPYRNNLSIDGYSLQGDPYIYISDPAHQDPAEYLYGLGYLDPSDTVEWGEKPTYKDTLNDGYFVEGEITNEPTIVIKDKDGKIIKTFSGDLLKSTLLYNYNIIYGGGEKESNATVKGKVTIEEGGKLPDAINAITTLPTDDQYHRDGKDVQQKLKKYFNVTWQLAPDVNRVGYQIGYIKLSPKDDSLEDSADYNKDFPGGFYYGNPYGVLVQVVPKKQAPTQPTSPVQPTNPKPTQPTSVQPTSPVQPTNSKPTQPTNNPEKSDPTPQPTNSNPVDPTPVQPTAPTQPTVPSTPAQPTDQVATVTPTIGSKDKNNNVKPLANKMDNLKHTKENSSRKGVVTGPTVTNVAKEKPSRKGISAGPAVTNVAHRIINNNANISKKSVHAENELPQTGEKAHNVNKLALIGLAITSFATLLGLIGDRKRN